ncbi:hypothetical protein C8R44DRAFT_746239 [Mycena epipterygia]|nr:hypothetical protein C8R44DRAFT_746239 [Mycena epipterygia]
MPTIMIPARQKGELMYNFVVTYDIACTYLGMDENFRLKRRNDLFPLPDVSQTTLTSTGAADDDDEEMPELIAPEDENEDDPALCCLHCRRSYYAPVKTKL